MTAQQVWRFNAFLFAALAIVSGTAYLRLKWRPGVDFDVTGFFWLLRNVPRLSALMFCIIFLAVALWCWIRSATSIR